MISIILPVYNRAKIFIKTLESIKQQSFSDFEVIIVNDGSTDDIEKIWSDYYQKLTTPQRYIFISQPNQGAPAARNRGEREARGEYLFFCDDDAILEPTAFTKMFKALENNPAASYAYPSFKWGQKSFKVGEFNAAKLRQMPCIHTMALIRRPDFPKMGWDEKIKKLQDWDLWLTMLEAGKTGIWVPEVLFTVKPGGTMSSWLPASAYRFLPFLPAVKKYKAAMSIIKNKHGLS